MTDPSLAGISPNVGPASGGGLVRITGADFADRVEIFEDVAGTASGLCLTDPMYKRNGDIVQQDRDGTTLRRWSLFQAWPIKFVAGDWDNESDEKVIESVTLTYDLFDLEQ